MTRLAGALLQRPCCVLHFFTHFEKVLQGALLLPVAALTNKSLVCHASQKGTIDLSLEKEECCSPLKSLFQLTVLADARETCTQPATFGNMDISRYA